MAGEGIRAIPIRFTEGVEDRGLGKPKLSSRSPEWLLGQRATILRVQGLMITARIRSLCDLENTF